MPERTVSIAHDRLTRALHLFRAQTWADLVDTYCENP